jgi:DNA-binding MarR family transcriptional regulator
MGPLRRLVGGLAAVSAAILVVLVAAGPAASAPTLAALSIRGGSTQALASVLCGTSGGVSCSAPVSCGPSTGVPCSAPVSCGPSTGVPCSAPVSCGPSTGVPCLLPYDWLPLPVTCGPSSGVPCPAPVPCGPSSGVSLTGPSTGPSCVIGKPIPFGQQPCGPSTGRPCGKLPQCVGRCRPLQISPSPARPGEPITVTGNDYARCNKRGSQVTLVQLFFGNQAVDVTGSGGSFSVQATVPADAAAGNYIVFVECYGQSHGLAPAASRGDRLLVVLEKFGPASQARLGGRAGVDRSDVVAALNDLAARGMIERKPDPADRSRNIVTITPAGRAHLREAASRVLGTRFLTVTKFLTATKAPGHSASGHSSLVALVSSGGGGLALGGLALMILLLLWALVSRKGQRHRDVPWVKDHLRAVAGSSPEPPVVKIRNRSRARSISLGLEPHDDHLRIQEN